MCLKAKCGKLAVELEAKESANAAKLERTLSAVQEPEYERLVAAEIVTDRVQRIQKNVYVCTVPQKAVAQARAVFERLKADSSQSSQVRHAKRGLTFTLERPHWGKSDITWISSADVASFAFWDTLFSQLCIAEAFGFLGDMVLFAGYFVSRRHTRKPHFHTDFSDTGGSAFTLMTPLYDMTNLMDCHLLGERAAEEVCQYRYTAGEAIGTNPTRALNPNLRPCISVFGDDFVHATQPGEAPHTLGFLCFTFGKRTMTSAEWEGAEYYIKNQCPVYRTPGGKMVPGGGPLE